MKYDYRCRECGAIQIEEHSMKDEPIIYCNQCRSVGKQVQMDRVISGGCGIIFKGSGFYETDYKVKK
jgi:putative FmdB family regulatory protein